MDGEGFCRLQPLPQMIQVVLVALMRLPIFSDLADLVAHEQEGAVLTKPIPQARPIVDERTVPHLHLVLSGGVRGVRHRLPAGAAGEAWMDVTGVATTAVAGAA